MPLEAVELPGGKAFANAVAETLDSGRSVFMYRPLSVSRGLVRLVSSLVRNNHNFLWREVPDVVARSETPLSTLAEVYGLSVDEPRRLLARDLAGFEPLSGSVLHVDLSSVQIEPWIRFIETYELACRDVQTSDRICFLIEMTRSLDRVRPDSGVCLSTLVWDDIVSISDLRSSAYRRTRTALGTTVLSELIAEMACQLALWDPVACDIILDEGTRIVEDPVSCLRSIYSQNAPGQDFSRLFGEGLIESVNGVISEHIGLLVQKSDFQSIFRRLWKAELAVLMPFIQESTRQIATSLEGQLRLPHRTAMGDLVSRIEDIEIVHLHSQIQARQFRVAETLAEAVSTLRRARNLLAHMEHLDARTMWRILQILDAPCW